MQPFVLDASLALDWCFADERTPYGDAVLDALETTHAVVPAVWPFEVANGLAVAERKGRVTRASITDFTERLRQLPIYVERRESIWLLQSLLPLAYRHQVSAYDAAYLELAQRESLHLATLDEGLRSAARAHAVAIVGIAG